MKWVKLIFVISLAIIFIGTTFVAVIGATQILDQVFRVYILKYETCNYGPRAVPVEKSVEISNEEEMVEKCYVDYNHAKRGISTGLSMLLIAFPIAIISKKGLKKSIKEMKE